MLCTAVWANQAISEDEPNFFEQFTDRDLTDKELAEELAKLTPPLSLFGGEGAKYAYTQSGSFFVVVYADSPLDSYGPTKSIQVSDGDHPFDTLENCNNALLKEVGDADGEDVDMKILGGGFITIFAPDPKQDNRTLTAHCMEVSFSGLPIKNVYRRFIGPPSDD